ncbi:MAG: hypothetical protein ACMUEM_02065 [Flavobacteriales bacterium AspAUS03]
MKKLTGLKAAFEVIKNRCITITKVLIEASEKPGKDWEGFKKQLKAG